MSPFQTPEITIVSDDELESESIENIDDNLENSNGQLSKGVISVISIAVIVVIAVIGCIVVFIIFHIKQSMYDTDNSNESNNGNE